MAKDAEADVEIEDQEIDEDIDLELDEEEKEDEEEADEEEDGKPVTKKDLKDFAKNFGQSVKKDIDKRFINKRHQQRDPARKTNLPVRTRTTDKEPDALVTTIAQRQDISDFAEDNDLSKKEVRYLVKELGRMPTRNDLKKPFIQGGLEKFRQVNDADANIPTGNSGRTFSVGGKSWEEMTPAEKQANFPARQAAIRANKR